MAISSTFLKEKINKVCMNIHILSIAIIFIVYGFILYKNNTSLNIIKSQGRFNSIFTYSLSTFLAICL